MSKTFNLYGKEIIVSDRYEQYNALRQKFKERAAISADAFIKKYRAYGSLEKFAEKGYDDGFKVVCEAANSLVIVPLIKKRRS